MNANRTLSIATPLILVLFALGYAGYRWVKSEAVATLDGIDGQAERDTAAHTGEWHHAQVGDQFQIGDGARTPKGAEATFKLAGGATLLLKQSSQVRFQRSGARGQLRVDVTMGQLDLKSGTGAYVIDSEFGEIMLDANSAISMSRDGTQLNIDVELGGIQLAERHVGAGKSVELELGGIVVDVPLPEPDTTPQAAASAPPPPLQLDPGDGIDTADLVVRPGGGFVVHDPNPPTAIGFDVAAVCGGPARVISGNRRTEARGQANLSFARGKHSYEVVCLDSPNRVAAKGNVKVLQDAGTRPLPAFTPTANVTADGRVYTVLYQHRLPRVTVSWPTAPDAESFTLNVDKRSIKTKTPSYTFSSLSRGQHSVTFIAATSPVRQSRTSTIDVKFDSQAPAARVSSPAHGFEPGETVTLGGQALPGWTVSVAGKEVELDAERKFLVQHDGNGSVPIAFSHPSRGTHYYIRRPRMNP